MRDMTSGSARSHLFHYALPLLLGNWLQLAYNAVDSIIAGRFIGKEALAAEGIAAPIMNLVILAITGLTIGSGILMSEYFGAKDFKNFKISLATMTLSGTIASSLIALICIALSPFMLKLLAVPDTIFEITVIYLRITFIGMPFTFFYNALSACLKSAGDTKTPLKFLAFSSILNAFLDLIFLGVFRFGIVCSAVTTVVAEAVSAILAGGYMYLKVHELWPNRNEWLIKKEYLKRIMAYGGPTALQQAVQPIGKLLIQSQVNALGVTVIAAFNAVTRMDDFACIPEQGISSSISTYIAQNRGAKREDRIRTGFRTGILMEVSYWVIIGSITALFKTPIVSMFVTGDGANEVIALGSKYLSMMAIIYLWPALTNGVQGFYRGMGRMKTMIMGTFIQISLRTLFTFILAPRIGLIGIAYACMIGWSGMIIVDYPLYWYLCKKLKLPKNEKTEISKQDL